MEVKERTEQHCETEAPNGGAEQRESDGDGDDNEADILQHAIDYCMTGRYPTRPNKRQKESCKRAKAVSVANGKVYLQRRKNKVWMIL